MDGFLLATVHMYSPPLVTVRVWVYCAVTGSSNTVSVPSVTVTESLVQVTVVAGPPVEMQVRVLPDNVTPSGMVIAPTRHRYTMNIIDERERANLVVQLVAIFLDYYR